MDHEGHKVLEEADLLLYDLKGMDPLEHMSNTGVSNERILINLKGLADRNKPIIIRAPIVPGYNDSPQGLRKMADFLSKLKSVERVDLLPYHKFGTVKYGQLGRIYKLNVHPPGKEYIDSLKSTFEHYGLKTQVGG
jgi:pyruvate formate lyase activating enzyme